MAQDIIVLTIVFSAAAYAVWSFIKALLSKPTGGCGNGCACSAKNDIKKAVLIRQKKLKVENLKTM